MQLNIFGQKAPQILSFCELKAKAKFYLVHKRLGLGVQMPHYTPSGYATANLISKMCICICVSKKYGVTLCVCAKPADNEGHQMSRHYCQDIQNTQQKKKAKDADVVSTVHKYSHGNISLCVKLKVKVEFVNYKGMPIITIKCNFINIITL